MTFEIIKQKANVWLVSDTHFNHENILKFEDKKGLPVRKFKDLDHMNETMIDAWNRVVKSSDKVYHLGDVYFGPQDEAEKILARLNGKKRLIVGNHDNVKSPVLQKSFQKIELWKKWSDFNMLLTHVPVHESVLHEGRFHQKKIVNVHGHIHQNKSPSENHFCVCVEQINYTPIHVEDLYYKLFHER